ncbi:MAG: hypothetical protein P8Y70_13185 [Candidatus Lokiarchaeota archaeon]
MKGSLNVYSPKSYFIGGFIGFFIFWFFTGLINFQDKNLVPSIISSLLISLIFGALPIWLGGLIRYLYYKPILIITVYNSHLEGKFKRISNKEKLKGKVSQLKYTLNPKEVDFYYYSEDQHIKIDYSGDIASRTEIFAKLMNFFKIEVNF